MEPISVTSRPPLRIRHFEPVAPVQMNIFLKIFIWTENVLEVFHDGDHDTAFTEAQVPKTKKWLSFYKRKPFT